MVADREKNGKDEAPGEATQIGGAPPPMPPPAPPAAPKTQTDDDDANAEATQPEAANPEASQNPEATQIGGAPPPPPPMAPPPTGGAAGPPTGAAPDATQIGGAPPPPPASVAPPAAPTALPGTAEGATVVSGGGEATVIAGGEATVIGGAGADATMVGGAIQLSPTTRLERLAPPEHRGEMVELDPTRNEYQVGRHEGCDVRLYSSVASRQHARLVAEPDGSWVLRPVAGKPVKSGRKQVEGDLPLANGMRITLGDDEFKVVAARPGKAAAEGPGFSLGSLDRTQLVLFGVIAALLVAIVAVLILR